MYEYKFIGTNSLGYEKGKIYNLSVKLESHYLPYNRVWIFPEKDVCKPCQYDSMKKFKENWEIIEYKQVFSEQDPYGEENWE